jgi:predicted transcriptional regulator
MKKLSEASSFYVAGEPLPEDSLLVAKFDLPPELAWFNELNVQERIDFFVGLLEVLAKPELTLPDGRQRTHMDAINEYLQGWQATVELESSPELVEAVRQGIDDMEQGRFASRKEVEEFLNAV